MRRRLSTTIALALACFAGAVAAPSAMALPKPPVLGSPANKAKANAVPAFTWAKAKGASTYEYQISASRSFTSIVLGKGPGRGASKTRNTVATLTETLPDGVYFWRVRSLDSKDRAGKWSAIRSFTRDWATQPNLLSPSDDLGVSFPLAPLVMRWSIVPHAFKYRVVIATNPELSSPVIGSTNSPIETRGTVFTPGTALAPGRYYWAVTPLDVDGHPGRMSRIGAFTWNWNTATTARLTDLNAAASVFDPQFSWDPIPGAARYEVEINSSDDFSLGSKVCCTDAITGTSLSPVDIFASNTYYWRVRGIDPAGTAGLWNNGPNFQKSFDSVTPSIPNLHMRDNLGNLPGGIPETSTPVVDWDPVPGASSYEVQLAFATASGCDWATVRTDGVDDVTSATEWAPLLSGYVRYGPGGADDQGYSGSASPGPASWGGPTTDSFDLKEDKEYCVRVLARSDRPSSTANGFISDWTYLNGGKAFKYKNPDPPGAPSAPFVVPAGSYLTPQSGSLTGALPLFTWQRVPGAEGYYIVVSKDATFTTVLDFAYVRVPVYSPGSARSTGDIMSYPDETTRYYWVVFPAANGGGTGVSSQLGDGNTTTVPFDKRSTPPAPLSPVGGGVVPGAPVFQWSPSEGARKYRLQVSADPSFSNPIDDILTASTSYTSSSVYPADADIFWRVRAQDEVGTGLSWSGISSFRRRLPVPAPAANTPVKGDGIPLLTWSAVEGATGYDVHVEQADGTRKDATVASPALAPVVFFGSGIFKWTVRANFKSVSGGYSASRSFTRNIPAPGRAIGTKTATRRLISWNPVPAAQRYKVEVAKTNSFSDIQDQATTANTSWAPEMTSSLYKDGGNIYWRVVPTDEGGAEGAAAMGRFVFPKHIRVTTPSSITPRKYTVVTIKLVDSRGAAVTKAMVRLTGAGVKRALRTDKRGRVKFRIRPRRSGKIKVAASKRGFYSGTAFFAAA